MDIVTNCRERLSAVEIRSIRVKHFREFLDGVTLHLAYSPEKNITLIQSEDSDALETLIQAFRWCLYGNADFPDGSSFLLHNDLVDGLAEGETQCAQVELSLFLGDVEYCVLREQEYIREGVIIMEKPVSTVTVFCKRVDGTQKALSSGAADDFIESLYRDISVGSLRGDSARAAHSKIGSGQVFLFATRAELEDLQNSYAFYKRVAKIYRIEKSVQYRLAPAWEDTALPKANELRGTESLPRFALPGRPALETLFNDYVVDVMRSWAQYRRLGVEFPGAMLLHGAPGSGKTHAVECLGEFLHWPRYYIDSGTVGSKYIHETGAKINRVFEQAAENAPSIIVIDEMDAFLSSRGSDPQADICHTEEVSEFLRRIPEAARNHVLVIGMTNRLDDIDPAFLRRGRFDHIVQVEMPTKEEMAAALEALLSKLPTAEDIELTPLSTELQGRPISDLAFVVKEAGRLSAKAGADTIGQAALLKALRNLPPMEKAAKVIGFTA